MRFKKSQQSFEFLTIFGIGLVLVTILTGIFYTYYSETRNSLDFEHITTIGDELLLNSEEVYYMGQGNRITYQTNFPSMIENITINRVRNETIEDNNGEDEISYDYLNITYETNGDLVSSIHTPNNFDLRLNCSGQYCNHEDNVSYFDQVILGEGHKNIRIESSDRNMVELSFQE